MPTRKSPRAPKAPPARARTSTVTSAEAQNGLGEIIGRVATGERVIITRYGRPQVVMLAVDEYEALAGQESVDLAALEREFDELVQRMQSPGQRAVAEAFFEMSGEELGEAAKKAAAAKGV